MIHRDIRLANVHLDNNDNAILGNFSLATAVQSRMKSLAAHTKEGSKRHMAPEVVLEKNYDYQADVWSFGVLLCQLTTFKLPFKNDFEACSGIPSPEIV